MLLQKIAHTWHVAGISSMLSMELMNKQLDQQFKKWYVPWVSPGGSMVMNSPGNAGDTGTIPGLERSPGEGNGNPPQYSCLGNPMDRGAWQATVHGVAKESDTT